MFYLYKSLPLFSDIMDVGLTIYVINVENKTFKVVGDAARLNTRMY